MRKSSNFPNLNLQQKNNFFFVEEDEIEVAARDKMWEEYESTVAEMDAFRREYSNAGAKLIGDIKTNMMDSTDAYFSHSQTAYEWASLVQPLAKAAINVGKPEGIVKALNKILDDGEAKLSTIQEKLQTSSDSFEPLASGVADLNAKFATAFDAKKEYFDNRVKEMRAADKKGPTGAFEKELVPLLKAKLQSISKFYADLSQSMNDEVRNIDNQKAKLQDEIKTIENLKSKIEPFKTVLNSESSTKDDLKKPAQELIDVSVKYRERHNEKSHLN